VYDADFQVTMTGSERDWYTAFYTQDGQAQGYSGQQLADFVEGAIDTIEARWTAEYHVLHKIYGNVTAAFQADWRYSTADTALHATFDSGALQDNSLDVGPNVFTTGQAVVYHSGSSITGLQTGKSYFAVVVNANTIRLAATADAASRGAYLDIDVMGIAGTTHSFTYVDADGNTQVLNFDAVGAVAGATDRITLSGHGLAAGQEIVYGKTAPAGVEGLVDGRAYFVVKGGDPDRIRLALTASDATGTDPNVITLGAVSGSGNFFSDGDVLRMRAAWSDSQLKNSVNAAILQPKSVASTGSAIEDPNVVGRNIFLKASGGDIGRNRGADLKYTLPLNSALSEEQKLALASAERKDVRYFVYGTNGAPDRDITLDIVGNPDYEGTADYIMVSQVDDINVETSTNFWASASGKLNVGSEDVLNIVNVTAGGEVRIKGKQGLVDARTGVTGSTPANVTGGDVILEGGSGGIGAVGKALEVSLTAQNGLTARANEDVVITSKGNLWLMEVFSTAGIIDLRAGGSILDEYDAETEATLAEPPFSKATTYAGSVYLQAGGSIGTADNDIETKVRGSISALATGDIFIHDLSDNVVAGVATRIGTIESTTGDVHVAADNGMGKAAGTTGPNFIGGSVVLSTLLAGSIGEPGGTGDVVVKTRAWAGAAEGAPPPEDWGLSTHAFGNIYVTASGDLYLNEVAADNGGDAYITAPGGRILNGRINEGSNVTSGRTRLFASGDIGEYGNAITSAVSFLEGRSINGNFVLDNSKDMTIGGITGAARGIETGKSGSIGNSCVTTVKTDILAGGSLRIYTDDDWEGHGGDDETYDQIIIESGRTITLADGATLTIESGDDVRVEDGATLIADHIVIGTVDGDAYGNIIEIYGTLTADDVTVEGGDYDDTIVITNTTSPTAVLGGAGNDLVHVGSLATPTSNVGGTTQDIEIGLSIDGQAGDDTVVLDDTGSGRVRELLLTESTIDGISPATIRYAGLEALDIHLGNASNSAKIRSTHVGTTTTVTTGTGDNAVYVGNTDVAAASTVNELAGHLILDGQGGTDTLWINDLGDGDDNAGAMTRAEVTGLGTEGIEYARFETMTVDLGVGDDDFDVVSTNGPTLTLVNGNAGDDTVHVGPVLSEIAGRLEVRAGEGTDLLYADNSEETAGQSGTMTTDGRPMVDEGAYYLTGLEMGDGVDYWGVERFHLMLGTGDDNLFVETTIVGEISIDLHDGNDVIDIGEIAGSVVPDKVGSAVVYGGSGNDTIRVNYDAEGDQTYRNGIHAELTVHGEGGSDRYEIGLSGAGSSIINVADYPEGTASTNDLGVNVMNVYGTDQPDYFMFRPNAIMSVELGPDRQPLAGGGIERVNYDRSLNGGIAVFGRSGDDTFVFDETNAPMTIYGDAGNDTFQVGQLFLSPRDAAAGLAPGDAFDTLQTTRGYLSNGVGEPTTIYGGTGNDSFTVYHTAAELFLFGEADDDTFRVRAFVKVDPNDPKKPFTNINGGQGADFIEYAVNAPINIDGGDGFDTLTVVGTEFGDDFVVTDKGIFGAGLPIRYGGLEKITLDGTEGNDTFFVVGTPEGVQFEIVGGLGSDTFNVAGSNGEAVTVVGKSLDGHSGLIENDINEALSSGDYSKLFVQDVSAIIGDADSANVVIRQVDDTMRILEDGTAVMTYMVALTRAPEEDVRVTASTSKPKEAETKAGGKGVLLEANDSGVWNEDGVTLLFTRENWATEQYVTVRAAVDTLAEGTQSYVLQHTVAQGADPNDGGAYDGAKVASLKVTVVDNDSAGVLVTQTGGSTRVAEGATLVNGTTNVDSYDVVLTRRPTGVVRIILGEEGGDELLAKTDEMDARAPLSGGQVVLTFDQDSWDIPQTVQLWSAGPDGVREGTHYARITQTVDPRDLDAFYALSPDTVQSGLSGLVGGVLTQDVTTAFDAETGILTISGEGFSASASFRETAFGDPSDILVPGSGVASTTRWITADVSVGGDAPVAGDTWSLMLNGKAYSYMVKPGDAIANVVQALAIQADIRDYSATSDGTTLSIASDTGSSFSVGLTIGILDASDRLTVDAETSTAALSSVQVRIQDAVVLGNIWTVRIDGVDYSFTAGGNRSAEAVSPVDVEIADAETPGVLVTQTNGETHVVEPTDYLILGYGQVTGAIDGQDGSGTTQFTGDFGRSVILESTSVHDSLDNAQNLDFGKWGVTASPEIARAGELPHITVQAAGDNTADYYSFTVTQDMLTRSSNTDGKVTVLLDIDHGFDLSDPMLWGSQIVLLDSDGHVVASGDGFSSGDPGTSWILDDDLSVDIDAAGTYTIKVENWLGRFTYNQTGTMNGIPVGVDYLLNVSVEEHAKSEFRFSPDPVREDEALNDTGQDIEASSFWSTYYDPTIGNLDFGGLVGSDSPYAKIIGLGDGSADIYTFYVSNEMLNPTVTGNVTGDPAGENYLLAADIVFKGDAKAGDTWTLRIDSVDYIYTAQADGLSDVVRGLLGRIATVNADVPDNNNYTLSYGTTNATDDTLRVELANGFRIDSLQRVTASAGSQTATLDTADAGFTAAVVDLGGTPAAYTRWTLTVGGRDYFYQVGATAVGLDAVTAKIIDDINLDGEATFRAEAVAGDTSRIAVLADEGAEPFTLSFTQSGRTASALTGTAAITGTSPDPGVAWREAQFVLTGTPKTNEVWQVTLDGVTVSGDKVGKTDDIDDVGANLRDKINSNGATKNIYDASYDADTDTLTVALEDDASKTRFTAVLGVSYSSSLEAVEPDASHTQGLTLVGTPASGQTWSVTCGSTTVIQPVDAQHDTLGELAAALASKLTGGNVVAQADGATIVATNLASGSAFVFTSSVVASGTPATADVATFRTIAITGAAVAGEDWSVSVAGDTIPYEVVSGDADAAAVATKVAAAINAYATDSGHARAYRAVASGATVVVSGLATTDSVSATPSPAGTASSDTNATARMITLSGSPANNTRYDLTVTAGAVTRTGTVTVSNSGTGLDDVINDLVDDLNAEFTDSAADFRAVGDGVDSIVVVNLSSNTAITLSCTVTNTSTDALITTFSTDASADFHKFVLEGGSPAARETWEINEGGTTKTATGASLAAIASSFQTSLSSVAGYKAFAKGDAILMVRTDGGDFDATANALPSGAATVGNPAAAATWTLIGTPASGQTWTGTFGTATATAPGADGGSLSTIASTLATGLNDPGYAAFASGTTVTVCRLTAGTLTGGFTYAPGGGAATVATDAIQLSGNATDGETWTVSIDGTAISGSCEVTADDQDVGGIAAAIVADMGLDADDGYTAVATADGVIVVTKVGSGTLALSATYTAPASTGGATVQGTPDYAWTETVTLLDLDGTSDGKCMSNDQWRLTVGSTTFTTPQSLPATATLVDLDTVASAFATALNGGGYVANASGHTLTISRADGSRVSVGPLTETVHDPASRNVTPDTVVVGEAEVARNHYTEATLSIATNAAVRASDLWTITVSGKRFEYRVPALSDHFFTSDLTVNLVAKGLADAINDPANRDESVTFSASYEGNRITITDDDLDFTGPSQSITMSLRQGDGTIRSIFDIDSATYGEGTIPIMFNPYTWGIEYNVNYVEMPTITLYAPDGEVVSGIVPDAADQGSWSVNDRFLDYLIDAEGTYRVEVGSVRHYKNSTMPDVYYEGVQAGIAYQLGISVPGHAYDPAVIDLIGKEVTIIGGTGVGQTGTIAGYDAERKIFTLESDTPFMTPPNETSVIRIGSPVDSFTPAEDSYNVVLTSAPVGEVVIDVVPKETRTYDSSKAFDAATNYGERNEVQARVATTRATVTLGGDAGEGGSWTVRLNNADYVGTGATAAEAAASLAAEISKNAAFQATVDASGVGVVVTSGSNFFASATAPAGGTMSVVAQLVFDAGNWETPQTVTVQGLPDHFVDGSDALVFPALAERVNTIRGPLTIDGGVRVQDEYALTHPFLLPGETNFQLRDGVLSGFGSVEVDGVVYATLTASDATHVDPDPEDGGVKAGFDPRMNGYPYTITILGGAAAGSVYDVKGVLLDENGDPTGTLILDVLYADIPEGSRPAADDPYYYAPVNRNTLVDEAVQVDTLNVFNGNSPADDAGVLTDTQLSGLGMGGDTVISGRPFHGGIEYHGVEALNLELGTGNDTLTIESTNEGTRTTVDASEGDDTIRVKTVSGQTTLKMDEGADSVTVGNDYGYVDQVLALLTVDGGGTAGDTAVDTMTVVDSGDSADSTLTLTDHTLTGLDMPTWGGVQTIYTQAREGTFVLRAGSYGDVEFAFGVDAGTMEQTLEGMFGMPGDVKVSEVRDIRYGVTHSVSYTVSFGNRMAETVAPTFEWVSELSALTGFPETATYVSVTTVLDPAAPPALPTVQTLTVTGSDGTFRIGFALDPQDSEAITWTGDIDAGAGADAVLAALSGVLDPNNAFLDRPWTKNVAVEKFGDDYVITFQGEQRGLRIAAVQNETDGSTSWADRMGGINYYGLSNLSIATGAGDDIVNVQGTGATAATRIDTGAGDDRIFVSSTANVTAAFGADSFQAGDSFRYLGGSDRPVLGYTLPVDAAQVRIAISDAAGNVVRTVELGTLSAGDGEWTWDGRNDDGVTLEPGAYRYAVAGVTTGIGAGGSPVVATTGMTGTLDAVAYDLEIEAGAGRNLLMIGDAGSRNGDDVTMDGRSIAGLAGGDIAYDATGGDFTPGITVWSGYGDDTFVVTGSAADPEGARTVTSLNTGLGDDDVTLSLAAGVDGFFVLNTQGSFDHDDSNPAITDDDTVDASASSLPLVIFGGQGNDDIVGGSGDDIVFGDRGRVDWLDAEGNVAATYGRGGLGDATDGLVHVAFDAYTVDGNVGGDDTIDAREGDNLVFGGTGNDRLASGSGDDLLAGDNGRASVNGDGILTGASTTDVALGGDDTLATGDGDDIAFGGFGNDGIVEGEGRGILFGDNGSVVFDAAGIPTRFGTSDFQAATGGNDSITAGSGEKYVFGGTGADTIASGDGRHFLLGDNGSVAFDAAGRVLLVSTADVVAESGGDDSIATREGEKVVFGGVGNDTIVTGTGDDVLVGDNGSLLFKEDQTPNGVESVLPDLGGDDRILAGEGDNVVIGGAGNDVLAAGSGTDFLIGDGGRVVWTGPMSWSAGSTDPFVGGNDVLDGGSGSNFLIGGAGSDVLHGNLSKDFMIGDNGRVTVDDALVSTAVIMGSFPLDLITSVEFGLYDSPWTTGAPEAEDGQYRGLVLPETAPGFRPMDELKRTPVAAYAPRPSGWTAPEPSHHGSASASAAAGPQASAKDAEEKTIQSLLDFFIPLPMAELEGDVAAASDAGVPQAVLTDDGVIVETRVADAGAPKAAATATPADEKAGDTPGSIGAAVAGFAGWNAAASDRSGRKSRIDRESIEKLEREAKDRRFRKWH
jgi:Ca2+-binding RTX toxin-like protein